MESPSFAGPRSDNRGQVAIQLLYVNRREVQHASYIHPSLRLGFQPLPPNSRFYFRLLLRCSGFNLQRRPKTSSSPSSSCLLHKHTSPAFCPKANSSVSLCTDTRIYSLKPHKGLSGQGLILPHHCKQSSAA